MSDNQIRIAIAEVLGWKFSDTVDRFGNRFYERGDQWRRVGDYPNTYEPLPDYLNDLNACAEFERTLSEGEITDYGIEVFRIMNQTDRSIASVDGDPLWGKLIQATARQRCEAFLRTKGLWK